MSSKIPETWSNSNQTLVEVHPFDDQYWQVAHRLKETMPDAHISKLWRVQNKKLWKFYCLHKEKLATNGICANESSVWHGTKTLDPSVIYSDRQDGFMMQYAKKGYWGCGIYFADDSVYSNTYSHRPINGADDRPTGQSDEHELIYTKLLKGNHVVLDACRELIVPPEDPISGLKYSTVAGRTQGYNVWIVYENGRAYPDYIVRYYGGTRDPKRTPYSSQKEAAARGGVCVAWEFSADSAWTTIS